MDYEQLSNGILMPKVGFGVYQISREDTVSNVVAALDRGYRHIDTARNYGNETEVGTAIRKSGVSRNELFITTKIYGATTYEAACQMIDEALEKLQVDYIDLLLFHWPSGNMVETYRAMEDYYSSGRLKSIGLSNFYRTDFDKIIRSSTIVPMVNQVEAHVFMQQREFQQKMDNHTVKLVAWSPLGSGKNGIFLNKTLRSIGKVHHKTTAQVALRFLLQSGFSIIPKTTHVERMKENLAVFDFQLTDKEMIEIKSLDTEKSLFGWY